MENWSSAPTASTIAQLNLRNYFLNTLGWTAVYDDRYNNYLRWKCKKKIISTFQFFSPTEATQESSLICMKIRGERERNKNSFSPGEQKKMFQTMRFHWSIACMRCAFQPEVLNPCTIQSNKKCITCNNLRV